MAFCKCAWIIGFVSPRKLDRTDALPSSLNEYLGTMACGTSNCDLAYKFGVLYLL